MRPPQLVRAALPALLLLAPPAARGAEVDFARDVLPILSDNCFHCHGPDPKARKAGLRLDTKDGAFRVKDGVATITAGKSGQSELVRRVATADRDEVMPPPDSNRTLTPKQVATLRAWVDGGAKWGRHWAFEPLPRETAVPTLPNPGGAVRNPIDAFVLARLRQEGLKPSPETPKETWLRRVTLDLTGLPPTPAEIDAFLADPSPAAHERVVDRLLASPRFGERMAADWLDVARFADTHGYQSDRFRPMWPYRDWVIAAFNRNQPFDQFLTDQLAGDLLPNATRDQRLATAFNRLHMQNEEGGVVAEEFRVAYVVDRVDTMGTAFLGLTFECCRCHDHKFDPLTQKDFYGLFALFQNVDESGQTSYFTDAMPVPTVLLSTVAQDAQLAAAAKAVAAKEAEVAAERARARPAFEAWLRARPKPGDVPGLAAAYSFDDWKDGKVPNGKDAKSPGTENDRPKPVPGKAGQGAELSGENGFTLPNVGHFTRSDPFTLSLWVNPAEHAPRAVLAHHSKAPIDAGSRGYELLLENGRVAVGLHHMWPGNSLKVVTKKAVPLNAWTHVTARYDGSSRAAGVAVYLDGEPAEVEVVRDGLWKDISYGGGEPSLAVGFRFRDAGFRGGKVDEFRVHDRAVTALEAAQLAGRNDLAAALATPAEALTPAQREKLFDTFFALHHTPAAKLTAELRAARAGQSKLVNPIPEAMAMREMAAPKPAFVLKRGAYDAPGDPVAAGTPAALLPFPPALPRNRLGLARWLTQPDHPLTARVTVNRLWQQMFGKGLVETSDNFGTTGTPPTHPELLDWLARDFVSPPGAGRTPNVSEGVAAKNPVADAPGSPRPWDVKRFLKQVALSATYRQSSRTTPELLQKDPYNQLLARSPARRLTAEMLRDQALAVSGLLVEKPGGPSVYPYQPDGLWDEAMGRPHYPRSKGADLYRRSLYTVWKRTAPPPQMTTFDAADRSVCSARRQTTSTPLQALALLNDPQIVEAARFLGQRLLKEGGATPAGRAAWAFRTATGRRPSDKEAAILAKLFEEQRADFAADPKAAAKLLAVGDSRSDPKLDPVDLAAATALALAILNHDETVTRR